MIGGAGSSLAKKGGAAVHYPLLNMQHARKSSTEVAPTPEKRSVQGESRKLYLEKDYHNELSKIMARLSPDTHSNTSKA